MQDIKVLGKVTPTCDGVHDINKEYSRLSIVRSSDNTKSYISKIDVPANIELTNEEYWQVLTNASFYADITQEEFEKLVNAQVNKKMETVLRRMVDMENRLTAIETAIENGSVGSGSSLTVELVDMNLPQPLSV